MILKRARWWLGDLLCKLGMHRMQTPSEGKYGRTGGDCRRCGMGPLV